MAPGTFPNGTVPFLSDFEVHYKVVNVMVLNLAVSSLSFTYIPKGPWGDAIWNMKKISWTILWSWIPDAECVSDTCGTDQ